MKLQVSARARRRANLVDIWWREHRSAAPNLFQEEMVAGFELLLSSPRIGVVHKQAGKRTVRRLLLQKTQQHIFYWVDEKRSTVRIMNIWGSARGRPPAIR